MLSLIKNFISGNHGDSSENESIESEEEESVKLPALQKNRLHGYEDYIGFKMVHWCRHRDGRGKEHGVNALLHLQMPGKGSHIFFDAGEGQTKQVVIPPRNGMRPNTKYRTNAAFVTGVRFFGEAESVKKALINFQLGRGYLLSGHTLNTRPYEYRLGKMHIESRASPEMKEGCGSGLHFFKNYEEALNYGQYNRKNFKFPIITKRLGRERGVVACIPDDEEQSIKAIVETYTDPQEGEIPLYFTPSSNYIEKVVSFVRDEVKKQK